MANPYNMLLVYPEVPKNTYWSFQYALPFVGKKSAMPPLGLATLAALFPPSCHLKLIDLNIQPLNEADIRWADAVFISAMIVQKASFNEVVRCCNRLQTPVVAGGPYPTASCEEIRGVDHFVLGEVEDIFETFLKDWTAGHAARIYRSGRRPDITHAPAPRFDLLDMPAYASMAIQYSRGCPFKCEFCDIWQMYGNTPRLKSGPAVLFELESLYRLGWRGPLFVVDDNFIGNKSRLKRELLPALRAWQAAHGFPFRFFTEASINLADDRELMTAMRACGFDEVFVGIETPSAAALKEAGKFQNLKSDMLQAVRKIQRCGIEVMAGFIMGFDSDTEDIADRMIRFIQQAGIPQAMVGLLSALPGTQLYRRLKKEGRLLSDTAGNNTHCLATNFTTRMDPDRLKAAYLKVLATLYDANLKNYFDRCSALLDHLDTGVYEGRKVHWQEVKMLLKSLLHQPFTPYGFQYLRFLLRNVIKNSSTFSEAVKFGIVGHHYHTMTQALLKGGQVIALMDKRYRELHQRLQAHILSAQTNCQDGLQNVIFLWNQMGVVLESIRLKVERVHVDFRDDILARYTDVAQRMKQLFEGFEDELHQSGVRLGQ
jgi:radical SAM superfamily enzyme YgiQ (UPF0313 family)